MASEYIALIPAYEPDDKMLDVIRDMKCKGFDIVVVDDGSGSEYADLFSQASEDATVLTHHTNKGKGAALKTGLSYISKYKICGGASPEEIVVVTVDADGQHKAGDAFRTAVSAASNPGGLVLGSRALRGDIPLRSRLGNTITRHVYRISTGLSVHDTQTGLRAFTADLIPQLMQIRGDRYEYETNMLLEFAAAGIPITEEEIETVYLDGNKSSHFNTIRDSFRVYREIIKFSASSFAGFVVDYAMYAILLAVTAKMAIPHNLILANIGARIVSSVTNYTINRKLVFKHNAGIARSALQYFTLAAFILAGNTAILSVLTGYFGIGRMIAKVITEIILFSISWLVQKYVIFYTAEEDGQAGSASGARSMVVSGGKGCSLKTGSLRRKPLPRTAYFRTEEDAGRACITGTINKTKEAVNEDF